MTAFTLAELKELICLMQRMLQEATDANWQALARLDSERRVLIQYNDLLVTDQAGNTSETTTPTPSTSNKKSSAEIHFNPEHQALIHQIRQLDAQILQTLTNAKELLLRKNRGLNAQATAQRGYAKAQSITTSHS